MSEFLSDINAYFASLTLLESLWLGIGFFGQSLFFSRWIIQWIASERKAESQMPIAFWYMSLFGGLIVLAYAIHRRDPVFIAGQSIGSFVYLRNLMLIYRKRTASG
ncbi:MAG: lipid-A-disaccharide synthase N-terminal domain-containing protein [Nitrospirae bacterium]|nr:lipid-A-disaccharide synthase N-terminal domain-containing protein [Nitrospirota bacterium]MDA1303837.1 lipid-A-disaccharide synthase N-terminal domain-containing protein [Nitrospirota bacterium]